MDWTLYERNGKEEEREKANRWAKFLPSAKLWHIPAKIILIMWSKKANLPKQIIVRKGTFCLVFKTEAQALFIGYLLCDNRIIFHFKYNTMNKNHYAYYSESATKLW